MNITTEERLKKVAIGALNTVFVIVLFFFGALYGHCNTNSIYNNGCIENVGEELQAAEEAAAVPETDDMQLARLDYYRSQTRYYNLLSIDYENILRGRGLIE